MLFGLVKSLIEKNLAKLSSDEKEALTRRVYLLDREFDLDIPYAVEDESDVPRVMLIGNCPEPADLSVVRYPRTYNFAEDSRRVSALVSLFKKYPDRVFRASGKSAALCEIASRFVPGMKLDLTSPDASGIFIPGMALLN